MQSEANVTGPFIAFTGVPRDEQLVVVDLGYSAGKKSCGLYWTGADRAAEFTFGDAIRHTAIVVRKLTKPLLILEAVLSTYHAPTGNPGTSAVSSRRVEVGITEWGY